MDTNKKNTLPHAINSTLTFKKKHHPSPPPPKKISYLKNQHPFPHKKNLHNFRDLETFHKTVNVL